jgi:hypothetical protein
MEFQSSSPGKIQFITQANILKQRGIIKWVKFGDEGTKFFHANATIKKRRNLITSLADNNGAIHSSHHIKAKILFVRPSRTGLVHQIHLKCFLI